VIDPSIALQTQPPQINASQLVALKDMAQRIQFNQVQLEEQQRQAKLRTAILGIYNEPGALDPKSGLPTEEAREKIIKISPEAGAKITKAALDYEEKKQAIRAHVATWDEKQVKMYQEKTGMANEALQGAMTAYEDAKKAGRDETTARAAGQQVLSDAVDKASKSGIFSPEELRKFDASFDPQKTRYALAGTLTFKEALDEKHREATAEETKRHNRAEESGQAATRKETARHHEAMEGKQAKSKPPAGYEPDPDHPGELRIIKGGPADRERRSAEQADALALYRAQYPMGPVKPGDPTPEQFIAMHAKKGGAAPSGGGGKPGAAGAPPAGIPTGSKAVGWSPQGKRIWQDPSGKKWSE